MLITAAHSALPDAAEPPEWLQLLPSGVFSGVDGRGPYRLDDPAVVIAASLPLGKLPIDENHSTDFAVKTGQPSPARAWIIELQARDSGIWGRIEWTPSGQALWADKSYRGISPVFEADKVDGRIIRLHRAALTNTPNLAPLATLFHQQGPIMDLQSQLRQLHGLPDTADDTAILNACKAAASSVTKHAAQLATIATAAGVTGTDATAIVTAMQAQRTAAGGAAELQTTVLSLQTQLQTVQAERSKERATAFIDAAIRAGKPILPVRDRLITQHMADPETCEALVNGMPSINAGGLETHARSGTGGGGGSADDLVRKADAYQAAELLKGHVVSNIDAVRHAAGSV